MPFCATWGQPLESSLPDPEAYGVGMVFLPQDRGDASRCEQLFEQAVAMLGQSVLGWRDVPVNPTGLGKSAVLSRPLIRQVFVARGPGVADTAAFERKLCLVRRAAEKLVCASDIPGRDQFYVVSLSARTVVYKGMLTAGSSIRIIRICPRCRSCRPWRLCTRVFPPTPSPVGRVPTPTA
jgi:glutamate synthase domain-containing protein 1